MGRVVMSERESQRFEVLSAVLAGRQTVTAQFLRLSRRLMEPEVGGLDGADGSAVVPISCTPTEPPTLGFTTKSAGRAG